jgi:hypothetical protein
MAESKTCVRCGETKPLDSFHKDRGYKDGLRTKCKTCRSTERKERYNNDPVYRDHVIETAKSWAARNPSRRAEIMLKQRQKTRRWLWAEKSNPCERCGNRFHPVAMQFDHLPGYEKLFTVAMSGNRKIEDLQAERKKCQLLCANCHHIVTWERKTGNSADTIDIDNYQLED